MCAPRVQNHRVTIRGLLLDFYGTVVEDDDSVMAAIAGQVAAATGPPITGDEVLAAWEREYTAVAEGTPFRSLRDCAAISLATVMAAVGCDEDPAILAAAQFEDGVFLPLRPGTREFLHRVAVPVCVVSDADHDGLHATITHHGLRFDAVVCSERVGAYKPAAAMFEAGLAALGLAAHEVLHVGDSLRSDVRGAHAAGIRAVWVNRRGLPLTERGPAAFVIADLSELDACFS
jgi:2-haloacid dehalogenase